jgi:hypothetical protein
VQTELKGIFLQELHRKIKNTNVPVMVGCDFNLIRYIHEKSNGSEYTIWMDMFNSFINDATLIEIVWEGRGEVGSLGLINKVILLEVFWTRCL